jgi:hypothetical protein
MIFKQIINDYITDTYIYFSNIIIYYIKNIYSYYINFFKNKNNIKSVHNEIYLYLNDITNKWNSNNIKNIDLICDIIYIYNKYNINLKSLNKDIELYNQSVNTKQEENNTDIQDQDMKYYTLGWYMYQNILSKN